MSVGAKIRVSGVVQGVGFRFFVHRAAKRLGLTGYVANTYNGNVEIEVEGNRSLIEEFISEVKIGPRAGCVTNVAVDWEQFGGRFSDFNIR